MQQKEIITKSLISSYSYFGLSETPEPLLKSEKRYLTSIQLVEQKVMIEQDFEIFDIFGEGKIYLLCIYNQENKIPITNIVFQDVHVDENLNQIKFDSYYSLCQIQRELTDVMKSISVENFKKTHDKDALNLSPYFKIPSDKCQILCYSRRQKEDRLPIIGLILEDYEKQNSSSNLVQFGDYSKKQLNMIRQKNKQDQIYQPTQLDFYPLCFGKCKRQDCVYDQLNNNITLEKAVIPEGIQLSEKKESQYYYQILNSKDMPLFVYIMQYYEEIPNKLSQILEVKENSQNKYIPYAIALISFHFFPGQFYEILQHLFKHKNSNDFGFLIDQLIYTPQFTFQNKKYLLNLKLNELKFCFSRNQDFPNCDLRGIQYFFKQINLNNIIQLYSAVLTGKTIRLLSNNLSNPGWVIEVLLALLYPIEYKGNTQSYLSQDDTQLFDSPINYIYGSKETFRQPDCDYYSYKFNLDYNIAKYISPPCELPYTEKLIKKLEPFIMKQGQFTEKDAIQIREIFFKINIKILKEAYKYISVPKKQQQKSSTSFYDAFFETTHFSEFQQQYQQISNFQQFENIFKQEFEQIQRDNSSRIHADPYSTIIQNSNNQFQKEIITSPYLTPKYYVQNDQCIIQKQVYRIWSTILNSYAYPMYKSKNIDFSEYTELENLLKAEGLLQDNFISYKKNTEILKKENFEDLLFKFQNKCTKCNRDLSMEEILEKMPVTYLKTKIVCSDNCNNEIQPKMFIAQIKREIRIWNIHLLQFKIQPQDICKYEFLETEEFWNLVFYFRLYSLPIPFINEYDETAFCRQSITLRQQNKFCMKDSLIQMQTRKEIKTELIQVGESNQKK